MTLPNHTLAGAVIALSFGDPLISLPLAFISHFVMDALPHFGYPGNKGYGEAFKHRLSYGVAVASTILFLGLVVFLITESEFMVLLAGLIAASPDAVGIYNYVAYEKRGKQPSRIIEVAHINFHRRIQKFERPWGVWVEVIVFAILGSVLASQLY